MTQSLIMIALVLAAVISLVYATYIKTKEQQYTRERFAFAALTSIVSLIGLGVHSVTAGTPWHLIGNAIRSVFGMPTSPDEHMSWSEQFAIVLLIGIGCYFIVQAYRAWDGQQSIAEHERHRFHEGEFWFLEGLKEAQRLLFLKGPLQIYRPEDYSHSFRPIETPIDTTTWHDHARELLQLRWRSHAFDPVVGWHPMQNCWIGKNVKTGDLVGLLCVRRLPSDTAIEIFTAYVSQFQLAEHHGIELFVVVEDQMLPSSKTINGKTVFIQSFSSLIDDLVDFEDYYSIIKRRFSHDFLPDSSLTLSNVFVSPLVAKVPDTLKDGSEIDVFDLMQYIRKWLYEPSNRHLAILGEYGQGKSSAALKLASDLIPAARTHSGRIPLLIELRGKSPSTLQPLELLGAWASTYQIDPKALHKLIATGRALLIFEGFDEMAGAGDLESRMNHFRALWKFVYPGVKMIITGRPNFFLDDRELTSALGVDRAGGSGPYSDVLYLRFFRRDQILESLRAFDQGTRNQIVAFSDKDQKFTEIAARPSLLYIIGLLWDSEDIENRQTIDSALILDLFISHSYKRQALKAETDRSFMTLSSAEREYFHDGVAAYMVRERGNNQILPDQYHSAVARLYATIPEGINLKQSATEAGPTRPLKERMKDRLSPMEDIETDVRTYGILTNDYSRPGALKFAHKSFFEFIFARYVARRLLGRDREETAAISVATDVQVDAVVDLPVSIAFLGELVGRIGQDEGRLRSTVLTLFDGIVLGGRRRCFGTLRTCLLLELLPAQRFIDKLSRPTMIMVFGSAIAAQSSVFSKLFGLHAGTPVNFEIFEQGVQGTFDLFVIPILGMTYCLGIIIPWIIRHGALTRRVALWLLVLSQMGVTMDEVRATYGRLVAWRLRRIKEPIAIR